MSESKHTPGYETETLDRLFLEWSQFTSARTSREIAMLAALQELMHWYGNHADDFSIEARTKARAAIAKATRATP